eukprot:scaffold281157_cov35-Attheya_sp.AAC.1
METTLPAENAKGDTTAKKERRKSRSRNAKPTHHPLNPRCQTTCHASMSEALRIRSQPRETTLGKYTPRHRPNASTTLFSAPGERRLSQPLQ